MPEEANKYYERGRRYYNEGRYKEAQQDYKKALSIISESGQQGPPAQKEVQAGYQHAASYASEGQKKEIPPAPPEKAVAMSEAANLQESKPLQYTIDAGDVLYITVWQEDLKEEVIVRPDGMISFPLVGDIPAVGLTLTQLDAEVTKRLEEYIKYPEVSVLLRKFGGQKVVILGEVNFPGVYAVTGRATVLEAVALAGGFNQDAVLSSVIVIQGGLTNPKGVRVNLNRAIMKADMFQNIVLNPQDIVYVPKKFIANVNYVVSQIIGPISSGAQSSFTFERLRDARW